MVKEKTQTVSTRLTVEQVNFILNSKENVGDFVRNAIIDKLESESLDFVNKNIQELEEEKKLLLLKKKLIEKKHKELKEIPSKEIHFLLETKKILEQQPHFTKGRINLYIKTFQKPYKISEPEFFSLLEEAYNKNQERIILGGKNAIQKPTTE